MQGVRPINAPYKVQAREPVEYHEPPQTRWLEQIPRMGEIYKTLYIYTYIYILKSRLRTLQP